MEANATDASASNVVVPPGTNENVGLDQLPKELHEMKIRDDETISYMAKHVVGHGPFSEVFRKLLQDKRHKNRELQVMHLLDLPNKDEVYLSLVMEYVSKTMYKVAKHYSKMSQWMPLVYVKLYPYQICRSFAYIHGAIGVCHHDIKPQNLLVNPYTHQLKLFSRYDRAPELIFGATEYTIAIDTWSVGCVLTVLGTPKRKETKCMNPNYTEFKFPQINIYAPVDLASMLLQYSPNLRCTVLEGCAQPFFNELWDPNTRLPNGCPPPPLVDFYYPNKSLLRICRSGTMCFDFRHI
ncbi:hypothetical protein AMTRI_Chr06g195730 [Amborella trichopoda]